MIDKHFAANWGSEGQTNRPTHTPILQLIDSTGQEAGRGKTLVALYILRSGTRPALGPWGGGSSSVGVAGSRSSSQGGHHQDPITQAKLD